jgi:hypothetical protein
MGLPIPFTTADIHAELIHVKLSSMHRSGAKGTSGDPTLGAPCRLRDIEFREFLFHALR